MTTLVAVLERRIAEVLMASDRGVSWRCGIIDHSDLGATLAKGGFDPGPSATAVRAGLQRSMRP